MIVSKTMDAVSLHQTFAMKGGICDGKRSFPEPGSQFQLSKTIEMQTRKEKSSGILMMVPS